MYRDHLRYLSDPVSHKKLKVTVFQVESNHIMAGLLVSGTAWYPIIAGIPRLLVGDFKQTMLQEHHAFLTTWKKELPKPVARAWGRAIASIDDFDSFLRHQKKTADSFAYEWRTIYRENDYEVHNFFHFLHPFLEKKDLKDRVVIDIGCGSGRFTKQAALAGAQVVFGTDLGESVGVAFGLTREFPNVCIVQSDIYAMPFYRVADVAMSIGVLHHLPQPKEGFLALQKIVKPKGKFLIWVYNRRNNGRALYFYEPIRSVVKNIPKPILRWLCYPPAIAVQLINYITVGLNRLGATKLAKRVPFSHYAPFPFNMKFNDAFDVLATPKSNYYFVEDIHDWFKSAMLKDSDAYEHPEAGITSIGTR